MVGLIGLAKAPGSLSGSSRSVVFLINISFEKASLTTFSWRRLALRANPVGFLVTSSGLRRDWNGSAGILNSAAEI
jgi:hypothetical protein